MTEALYQAKPWYLRGGAADVNLWSQIFNYGPSGDRLMSVLPVDRCGYVTAPYRTKVRSGFELPRDLGNFTMSYEECCVRRAEEVLRRSEEIGKRIVLMYSGGIDSTLMLVILLKHFNRAEVRERVVVALNSDSVAENQNFYFDHICKHFSLVSSERLSEFFNGSYIVLAGEQNDQLLGSDMAKSDFEELRLPYSREVIVGLFTSHYALEEKAANLWFDLLDSHIKTQAPCEVSSNFHFLWWFNFTFKWQPVWFRMLQLVDKGHRQTITGDFLDTQYFHFFSTNDFQKWSMLNPQERQPTGWKDYKRVVKRLIYEFNGDKDYCENKIKIQSFYRMFLQKIPAAAITSELRYIERWNFNKEAFYNSDNSFAQGMT